MTTPGRFDSSKPNIHKPLDEYRKAIVWVHEIELRKLARGLILPEGYHLVQRPPWYDNQKMAWGMIVEGPDIPIVPPGTVIPDLEVYTDYEAIVVRRYGV